MYGSGVPDVRFRPFQSCTAIMRRCSQKLMRTITSEERKRYGRTWAVDRIYSIKRSKLYEMLDAGLIKSVVIKEKGAKSGVRLFNLQSIEDWLRANTV